MAAFPSYPDAKLLAEDLCRPPLGQWLDDLLMGIACVLLVTLLAMLESARWAASVIPTSRHSPPPQPTPPPAACNLLFDGSCVMCNGMMRFIDARIPARNRARVEMTPLQDPSAPMQWNPNVEVHLRSLRADPCQVLIRLHAIVHGRSLAIGADAVMQVARELVWPYPVLFYLGRLIPERVRDRLYMLVSRNRLRWFGEEICVLPTRPGYMVGGGKEQTEQAKNK